MVSQWSLSDSKSPRVSSSFLSILADLNKAVVWIFSTRPLISKSSNPLITVQRATITNGITVTFMFNSFGFFFQFSGKVHALVPLFAFFQFYSVILFIFFSLSLGLVVWSRLGDPFVSQNPKEL